MGTSACEEEMHKVRIVNRLQRTLVFKGGVVAADSQIREARTVRVSKAQPTANGGPRLLYDRKEASRQLSISVRSLDYIIAAKGLDTRRIGKKVLVTHASLVRYATANHFDPVSETSESTAALSDASSKCA
jgi:hypothetical protein